MVSSTNEVSLNQVVLVYAGWTLALGHLTAALVQAATIIGIPTAVTSVELAVFALCALCHILWCRTCMPLVQACGSTDGAEALLGPGADDMPWLHNTEAVWHPLVWHGILKLCCADCVCRWPFGQGIRKRFLPTTVEELHAEREHRTLTVSRPTEPLSEQMDPYDTEEAQL